MSGPYGDAWKAYREAGWPGVIPLPPRRKANPPDGWTGGTGAYPSYADCAAWAEDHAAGNIALRLPEHIIGIDVDAYGSKQGAATLAALEAEHGTLPPTWRATSRDDGISGIRLYSIPEGLAWPGEAGDGIEIIQWRHRYVVTWPSVHPEGRTYRWITPEGLTATTLPDPDNLTPLPGAWVEGITRGKAYEATPRNDWGTAQTDAWVLNGERSGEQPCTRMQAVMTRSLDALHAAGGSAHNTALAAVLRVVRLADEGHAGLPFALAQLHGAFITAVMTPGRTGTVRSAGEAAAEWQRNLTGAVNVVTASPANVDRCDCGERLHDLIAPPPTPTPHDLSAVDAPPPQASQEARDAYFEQQVATEVFRGQVRAEAARRLRAGTRTPPPPITPLADFLEIEDEPQTYRIDGLWPAGGRVMLAAQFKAGKTTMVGNLVRALADGAPFLGRHDASTPDGRIVIIDDELDERMLRRWLREQGVQNADRVGVVSLRGKASSFDILDQGVRSRWATALREAGAAVVILDCLAPLLDVLGLSEDKEAGRFLVAFDELLGESGVSEAVCVHHMGHNAERSRGASRLRDWPDVEWRLVRDKKDGEDNPAARRYFSAYGRDVDVSEALLEYDPLMRRLDIAGGSRKDEACEGVNAAVLDHLTLRPWSSGKKVCEALADEHSERQVRESLGSLVRQGKLRTGPGPRNATLYSAVENLADKVRNERDAQRIERDDQERETPPVNSVYPAQAQYDERDDQEASIRELLGMSTTTGNNPVALIFPGHSFSATSATSATKERRTSTFERVSAPPTGVGALTRSSVERNAGQREKPAGRIIEDGRIIDTDTGEDLGPATAGAAS